MRINGMYLYNIGNTHIFVCLSEFYMILKVTVRIIFTAWVYAMITWLPMNLYIHSTYRYRGIRKLKNFHWKYRPHDGNFVPIKNYTFVCAMAVYSRYRTLIEFNSYNNEITNNSIVYVFRKLKKKKATHTSSYLYIVIFVSLLIVEYIIYILQLLALRFYYVNLEI